MAIDYSKQSIDKTDISKVTKALKNHQKDQIYRRNYICTGFYLTTLILAFEAIVQPLVPAFSIALFFHFNVQCDNLFLDLVLTVDFRIFFKSEKIRKCTFFVYDVFFTLHRARFCQCDPKFLEIFISRKRVDVRTRSWHKRLRNE